jgi:glycosyltransferase involved in cell wall biosynthesis
MKKRSLSRSSGVTVIIPTLNEQSTISGVVKGFFDVHSSIPLSVMVVDGSSTDDTQGKAEKAGANVVLQTSRGKGRAMIEAVEYAADADVCVFVDGDGTYQPREVLRIAEPVLTGKADMVIGSRLAGKRERGSIPPLNLLGNRVMSLMVSLVFKERITDILSGYRAVRTETFRELRLSGHHFEVEVEMTVKALRSGLRVAEVPITYLRRRGQPTKLRPLKDGILILRVLVSEILRRQ